MALIPQRAWNPLDEVQAPTEDDLSARRRSEEEDALDQAYRACFSSPAGRRVLEHMTASANTMTGFDPGFGLLDGIANGFAKEGIKIFINTIAIRIERAENPGGK